MPYPSPLSSAKTEGFEQTEMWTNLDQLLRVLGGLCADSPAGMWVASTDMLLHSDTKQGE